MEELREFVAGAVIVADRQKKLTGFNARAEQLLELQSSQVLRHPIEVLPAALREVIDQTFVEARPQERPITFSTAGQRELALHVSTSLFQGENGSPSGVVAVLKDLASAKELEQHVRHLDGLASIGTLSASMAHEIKNALVPLKTFVELLIKNNKGADLADIANREIKRIDSIVSQMLKFAGPAKPTFALLHLHDVLEHCLRLVEHQLVGKKLRLAKSLVAAPDLVRGDSYQLEQAVLNLFMNAIEAMQPNGQLSVTTGLAARALTSSELVPASQNPQLRLRIKDSGVGIPPENIPRLFEPFFTTKKDGSGLGLSITRRIIQEHSGEISVQSAVNKGTTFTILLPSAAKT